MPVNSGLHGVFLFFFVEKNTENQANPLPRAAHDNAMPPAGENTGGILQKEAGNYHGQLPLPADFQHQVKGFAEIAVHSAISIVRGEKIAFVKNVFPDQTELDAICDIILDIGVPDSIAALSDAPRAFHVALPVHPAADGPTLVSPGQSVIRVETEHVFRRMPTEAHTSFASRGFTFSIFSFIECISTKNLPVVSQIS